jgi:hypothetical protein
MLPLKKIALSSLLVLLFFGCRKSTNANWDVDVVFPVVNSVLNIKNFVNDSLFRADSDGLLHIVLNRELTSIKLDSLIKLPDTTITSSFVNSLGASIQLGPGQVIPNLNPTELEFDIGNGVKLKRVEIRKGFLKVEYTNTVGQPLDLIYKMPKATKNGQPLVISETIPTGTNSLVKSYDLSGYSFDMRGLSGIKYNTIYQTYTVAINQNADTAIVLANQGARLVISYSEVIPQFVEGYFGQQTIDIPLDTANFGFADNFTASNFMLSEAKMDFDILNEFGAEFSGSLAKPKSVNTINNTAITLNTNQLTYLNINRATRSGTTVYPTVKSIAFNTSNSNVTAFISNLPNKISYQGSIQVNPLGNISGYNDFAFYNTGIRIMANIDIPLKYTADYFLLNTTAKVDFANVEQLKKVNSGNFIISATNGFPFTAVLQAYLYDTNNNTLDSLFIPGSNSIERGTVDANNIVISSTQKRILVPINQTKIENLRKCKTIKIVSKFVMPANPPEIKILEKYEMKINVVAELNYNVALGS